VRNKSRTSKHRQATAKPAACLSVAAKLASKPSCKNQWTRKNCTTNLQNCPYRLRPQISKQRCTCISVISRERFHFTQSLILTRLNCRSKVSAKSKNRKQPAKGTIPVSKDMVKKCWRRSSDGRFWNFETQFDWCGCVRAAGAVGAMTQWIPQQQAMAIQSDLGCAENELFITFEYTVEKLSNNAF